MRIRAKVNNYIKKNDEVFEAYLSSNLSTDDLQGVMDMIDHPEIHTPLMKHVEALVTQPNFTDDMKTQFYNQVKSLPKSSLKDTAMEHLMPSNSLLDELNVVKPSKKVSFREHIKNRIKSTYESINDRIDRAEYRLQKPFIDAMDSADLKLFDTKVKVTGLLDRIGTKLDNMGNKVGAKLDDAYNKAYVNTKPVMDMLLEATRDKFQDFNDEFATRKLAISNDINLTNALANGMPIENIREGVNYMDVPEVRYGMINNVSSILEQKEMTVELGLEYISKALPYVADMPDSQLKTRFLDAAEQYTNEHDLNNDIASNVVEESSESSTSSDIKSSALVGSSNGNTQWATNDGVVSEDIIVEQYANQYPNDSLTTLDTTNIDVQLKESKQSTYSNEYIPPTMEDDSIGSLLNSMPPEYEHIPDDPHIDFGGLDDINMHI